MDETFHNKGVALREAGMYQTGSRGKLIAHPWTSIISASNNFWTKVQLSTK